MDMTELVGLLAGTLTTVAFVPQVIKTWRTGRADDFSLPMLVLFTVGVGLWLAYGVLLERAPIILPNIVTLALAGYLLRVKLVG